MSLPIPTRGEAQDAYVARCMDSDTAVQDYPDDNQRSAVCSSTWENAAKGSDLTAPIVWKDEDRRIVYGPVLVPDVKDADGDVVTADKIERVAHKFMEEYRLMEHMHTLRAVARPVESYIAPVDLTLGDSRVPKGSWVVGAKIQDDDAWSEVKSGRLTGFSIVAVPAGALKSEGTVTKLTLRDIEKSGRDWEVIAIGLVDKPSVPLAKWTAVKRAEPSTWDKLKSALVPTSQPLSATHIEKLQRAQEAAKRLDTAVQDLITADSGERSESRERRDVMEEAQIKEITELVGTAIGESMGKVTERLDALEDVGKKAKEKSDKSDDDDAKSESVSKKELEEAVTVAAKAAAAEAVSEVLVKFEEHIEAKPKASATALAESLRGQDGHSSSKKSKALHRDAFGRRVTEEV